MEPTEPGNGKHEGLFEDMGYTPGGPASSDAGYAPGPVLPPEEPSQGYVPGVPAGYVETDDVVRETRERHHESELEVAAFDQAEADRRRENNRKNAGELKNRGEQIVGGRYKTSSSDDQLRNLNRDAARMAGLIKDGNALYDFLQQVGYPIYDKKLDQFLKKDIEGYTMHLDQEIKDIKIALGKREKSRTDEGGLYAQKDELQALCRDTAGMMYELQHEIQNLTSRKAMIQQQHTKYGHLSDGDPGNEEYINRKRACSVELNEIDVKINDCEHDLGMMNDSATSYDLMNKSVASQLGDYKSDLREKERALHQAKVLTTHLNFQRKGVGGTKSRATSRREMTAFANDLGKLVQIINHNGEIDLKAREEARRKNGSAQVDIKFEGHQNGVNAFNSQQNAVDRAKMRSFIEEYMG